MAKNEDKRSDAQITISRESYEKLVQQGQDAAHVVSHNLGTRELVACGCEQCERVHAGMLDAGLVSKPWSSKVSS